MTTENQPHTFSENEATRRESSWQIIVLGCVLIAVLTWVPYSKTLDAGFHLDDVNITGARNLRMHDLSWRSIKETFYGMRYANPGIDRPVAYLSFGLNYYFGGPGVRGFHIVNITIHAITAVLLFLLVRTALLGPRLARRYGPHASTIALFSALLWALHPVQTQAVTYIIQRMTSMAAMFFLASLLTFVAGRRTSEWTRGLWYTGSLVLGLLAFGAKENTVFLPIVLLLFDRFFFSDHADTSGKRSTGRGVAVGAAAILTIGVTVWLVGGDSILRQYSANLQEEFFRQHPSKGFSPYERLLTEPRVLFDYLGLLVYPALSRFNAAFYDYPKSVSLLIPPTTALAIAGIVLIVVAAVLARRKTPVLSFAILWFVINSAIEASFLPLFLYFEHRVYLPSMWLFVLLPLLAFRFVPTGRLRLVTIGVLVACVVALGVLTHQRNLVWQNDYTLWKDVVEKSPANAVAHSHFANALMERREIDRAIQEYNTALRINPYYGDAYSNLGLAYLQKREPGKAVEMLRMAIRTQWGYPYGLKNSYRNLGLAYQQLGQQDKAREAFEKARSFSR